MSPAQSPVVLGACANCGSEVHLIGSGQAGTRLCTGCGRHSGGAILTSEVAYVAGTDDDVEEKTQTSHPLDPVIEKEPTP